MQRVVVAAGIPVFEPAGFVVGPLRIFAFEEEPFNFVSRVECKAAGRIELVCVRLQNAANVRAVGRAVFVNHLAETQTLAGPEDVGRSPIERGPGDSKATIALALSG